MSGAATVAIRIALTRDHEPIARHGVARLGAKTRSKPPHRRVAVLLATAYRISLNIALLVVVADLVRMRSELLWRRNVICSADCAMARTC